MKVQRIVKAMGEYAKINEDIKDGDNLTILNDGQIVTGDYGDRHVFKIETRNGEKNLSFNQTSMNNLIDAWGDETEKWKGKSAKVWLITQSVSGKMKKVCYLTAPDWQMVEDSSGNMSFTKPRAKDDRVAEEDQDITPDDIPF